MVFLFAAAATDLTGAPVLALSFTPTLDNSGTSAAVRGGETVCIDAVCSGGDESAIRSITVGIASTDSIFASGFDS